MKSRSKNNMKSDAKAIELRNKGNDLYVQSKFFDSIIKYNESLCFAEDQQQLAFAYGNRSAAYMELKLYKQCLRNIQLAREHNYPVEKMTTLDNREAKCKKEMANEKQKSECVDPLKYVKLSYPSNPKIPFIIESLEVKKDKKRGKGIFTNRALKVGDIISIGQDIGQPFATQMLQSDNPENQDIKLHYCSHCLDDNLLDLSPCTSCNSTMFCNDDCKSKAQTVHKYECAMDATSLTISESFVVRTFLTGLNVVNGSAAELVKLLNEEPKTVFDVDWRNINILEQERIQFKLLVSMPQNDRPVGNESSIYAALHSIKPLKELWSSSQEESIRFIIRYLINLNIYSGSLKRTSLITSEHKVLGNGYDNFAPLLNCSCNPNVVAKDLKNNMIMMITRPIASGEQLFIYGGYDFFLNTPFSEREKMFKNLSIGCDCEACKEPSRYTIMESLKIYDRQLFRYASRELMNDNDGLSQEAVYNKFRLVGAKMQAYYSSDTYPSQEYAMLSAVLMKLQCLSYGVSIIE